MFELITNLWKKTEPKYQVIQCSGMPSLVGMHTIGEPVLHQTAIFMGKKGEYRTIKPIKLVKKEETTELYTDYLYAIIKKIQ